MTAGGSSLGLDTPRKSAGGENECYLPRKPKRFSSQVSIRACFIQTPLHEGGCYESISHIFVRYVGGCLVGSDAVFCHDSIRADRYRFRAWHSDGRARQGHTSSPGHNSQRGYSLFTKREE